jgi:hypothetical protein
MHTLIEQAREELRAMPTDAQDAIARDLLDLIRAERKWEASFADPRRDELFDRMAQKVRADISAGRVTAGDPSDSNGP